MPAREVDFQQDLCFLLRAVIRRRPEFRGIRFEDARMEFPAADGRADIAVLRSGGRPFLIIETKRKNGREQKDIDPLAPAVLRQANGYASILGAPYFATANPRYLAMFRVPEPREEFRIERHRVLVTQIPALTEDFAARVLDTVAAYDTAATDEDRRQLATGLDWTFIVRLRSFVDWLTRRAVPAVERRLAEDAAFRERLRAFAKETGAAIDAPGLAREMAYILANRVLFYKVLERHYDRLDRLDIRGAGSVRAILDRLDRAFADAVDVTEDFEAVFLPGLYGEVDLSAERYDLLDIEEGVQGFIEDMEKYRLEDLGADLIGHVYEGLIPDEERHDLGQFYTPPAVAEFLVRWAVRSGGDVVLDPAAGSGTFVVKAYQRLRELKKEAGLRRPDAALHRELLGQLYAIDINPFPAHLTAMNLAMRDVRHPVSELNVLERDFFTVPPGSVAIVTYRMRTAAGEERRHVTVPLADAVVANPPYTRWLEIPDATRGAINARLGKVLGEYGLTARIRGGVETALYQHFVIYGREFLKDRGRLAMIVSSSWLQTEVGVSFGRFLLDRFRVHAVIDLGPRLFPVPLVAASLILLERCDDAAERAATRSLFAYVDKPVTVDDLTDLLARPDRHADRFRVRVVPQGELPRDRKWVEVLFGFPELEQRVRERTIPVAALFDVTRGTIRYCAEKKRGLGANEFFFVSDETVRVRGLRELVVPALPSIRNARHFTFGRTDWQAVRRSGGAAYLFSCRRPRQQLAGPAVDYIRWGESGCRTRDDVVCSKSQACAERGRDTNRYAGWYDVGVVRRADFFSSYYSQYRRRFVLLEGDYAMDHDFLAFVAKEKLSVARKKAVLACLNSTLGQAFVEIKGRTTGGGMASMEAGNAENLPVPDVRELARARVEELAAAFDSLEAAARRLEGARDRDAGQRLKKEYDRLDRVVAHAVGLSAAEMERLRELRGTLALRRTARAAEPTPESLRGADAMLERPPKRKRRPRAKGPPARRLDEFGGGEGGPE